MGYELDVGEDEDGSRLDVLLVRRVEGMSRAKARRMIDGGGVRVNGRRAHKGDRLASGDHVVLDELPTPADFPALAAPELPLAVRFEDAHLVIADKPAGLPSHPLRVDERETFAGALLARYPEMAGVGYAKREPGILHRLDNDTSGLMLAARTAEAFEALRALLVGGAIEKRYLALVAGAALEPGVIDAPIAPHPSDPRRVHVCLDPLDRRRAKARPARTEILRVARAGRFALLEVRASLAVRHQIRAHLSAVGHPLAGDWLYGGPSVDGLDRHFLHASRIAFEHPIERAPIDVSSPLPDDLAALVRALEAE